MTWEEKYFECDTVRKLEEEVDLDILISRAFKLNKNIPNIIKAGKKIAEEKFGINFVKEEK